MNKIDLTIVIPAYNIENYIKNSIQSVIKVMNKQSEINYEILVIDDGSTDSTPEKLGEIKNLIRIYSQPKNMGVSEARNTGIMNARGKYIYFFDGDDCLNDNFLNGLVKIKENPDFIKFESRRDLSPRRAITKGIHVATLIIKKEIVKSWKFIPGIYYEDNHFMFKVISFNEGRKITGAKGFPFNYLKGREGSIMNSTYDSSVPEKSLDAMMEISEKSWIWKGMFFQLHNSISYQNKKNRYNDKASVDKILSTYWALFENIKVKGWTLRVPFIFFLRYWIKKVNKNYIF